MLESAALSQESSEQIPPHFAIDLSIKLDYLLIAIESIDLSAVEVMLLLVEQLNLEEIIPNRVALWRLRGSNPLRKQHQKLILNRQEAKALTAIAAGMAKILNTYIRLLVNTQQQAYEQKIEAFGLQQNLALVDDYVERFCANYRSRMKKPLTLNPTETADLARQLLIQLLFCSGVAGEDRLWHNLINQSNLSN
jgi:Protein of unknown function (DUF3038)